MYKATKLLIYTDASFKDKCGGWGAVFVCDNKYTIAGGKVSAYIDNSGSSEFFAIYKALLFVIENFPLVSSITFNTDHQGIVSSFKRYIKDQSFNGISINKGLILLIFNIAKKYNIFINTNHVKGHQAIAPSYPKKTFENLKKTDRKILIQYHKSNRHKNKPSIFSNQIYKTLRKIGWNKSAIYNTIADSKSKVMRKRHSRNNNFAGFISRNSN